MGYAPDTCIPGDWPNRDKVMNHWNTEQIHYNCHHEVCVVIATARMYFTSEEGYLAHWNPFHTAATPWLVCPTASCTYIATGEPDALDRYLGHVADHHFTGQSRMVCLVCLPRRWLQGGKAHAKWNHDSGFHH